MTAAFAFLLSRFPSQLLSLIEARRMSATSVSIEEQAEDGRYDILVRGVGWATILEGKLGYAQDPSQVLRYAKRVRRDLGQRPDLVLVDRGSAPLRGRVECRNVGEIRNVTWDSITKELKALAHDGRAIRADPLGVAVAEDLARHLEEVGMTETKAKEVLIRDLWTRDSVELYFKHGIYCSLPKYLPSMSGCLYFAPYFTDRAPGELAGFGSHLIQPGISWTSRIHGLEKVRSGEFGRWVRDQGVEDPTEATRVVRRVCGRRKEIVLVHLGRPFRMLLTPVVKAQLGIRVRARIT